MLEYSIVNDAVYCFVCLLFSKSDHQSKVEWVNCSVRQCHKMKSRGKGKSGKLIQNFVSFSHKNAMIGYCGFINQSKSIELILI